MSSHEMPIFTRTYDLVVLENNNDHLTQLSA
jgi:hypothetical protein